MNVTFIPAYRGLAGRYDTLFGNHWFICMRFVLQYPLQQLIYKLLYSTAKYEITTSE